MTTHEWLVNGRNYIARYGWKNGGACEDHGDPACAGNALFHAGPTDRSYSREASTLLAAVGVTVDPQSAAALDALYEWNDAPGRTKAEVLAAFDRAIAATAPAPDLSLLAADAPLLERVGA